MNAMRTTLRVHMRPASRWPAFQRPALHRAFAAAADDSCHYKALGVAPEASPQQIKQAYRKLAMECHPDRSDAPDAEDRFKRVSQAYSVLSDDAQRSQYDAQRRFGFAGGGGGGAGAGPFSGPFAGPFGGAQPNFTHADAERMFRELERELGRQMATAQRMQQPPRRGSQQQQQQHVRRQQQEFVRQMEEQMRRQGGSANPHQQRVVINMAQMTPEEQEQARKMVRTAAKTAAKTIGRAMVGAVTDAMARKARSVFDNLNPFSSKKKKK